MNKILFFLIVSASLTAACAGGKNEAEKVFRPGDIVPEDCVSTAGVNSFFRIMDIPDSVFAVMQGKSFKAGCNIPRGDLKYLTCLHRDADGRTIMGEMVVNSVIAEKTLAIFRGLYEASYPIERMMLIDNFGADDETSMENNNSSAFNFRFISHTTVVSNHGKGVAIDVNPLYNPYHKVLADGKEVVEPSTARPYLDRTADFPYKIVKGDLCYNLFTAAGFEWGGDWKSCKDYQHFEYKDLAL